ncbi:holocytochrome-c synthase [Malassezia yamatoensis]|uniref:Holocytochrome c-type synthase n=1 Tax=Malassezia yamatoensis TaxID=253288 RepID=A0AAJ5YXZ5_9BASI|nr:holocytochrome-c synthase [Malassezia yamatoensis]
MGATLSSPNAQEGAVHVAQNNQQAVAALLLRQKQLQQGRDVSAKCPIAHLPSSSQHTSESLNPLNQMPYLSQDVAPSQNVDLSKERTVSSIPRAPTSAAPGDSPYDRTGQCPIPNGERQTPASSCPVQHDKSSEEPGNWEYPSPQQFYNALVRKGWETPEENVEMMVMIHNFLNERAWQEVIEWEKLSGSDVSQLQLARFQGRPGTLSPRARVFHWLGWAMPSRFNTEPPFDRHDWVVRRAPTPDSPVGEEVRYIIDYYSSPDDPDTDEPSFYLDVRPALDSLGAARARWKKTWEEYRNGELFAAFHDPSKDPNPTASTPINSSADHSP